MSKEIEGTHKIVSIDDLPNEILEYTFCFLTVKQRIQTELVCKRWREIGKTVPWSWPMKLDLLDLDGSLNISHTSTVHSPKEVDPPTENTMRSILSRCGISLKQLTLAFTFGNVRFPLTSEVFSLIADTCPNLTDIRLNLYGLGKGGPQFDFHFINLAKGCKKLKQIRVESWGQLNDSNFSEFLKHCHSLEYLVLAPSYPMNDFVDHLNKNLKGFYVHRCVYLNLETITEKLMDRCGSIEGLGFVGPCRQLDTSVLKKVVERYRNTLKIVYLGESKSGNFTASSELHEIPKALRQLEEVSLAHTYADDKFMTLLGNYSRHLKALNVIGCDVTDGGVSALASLPTLSVLELNWSAAVGEGMRNLVEKGRLEGLFVFDDRSTTNVGESNPEETHMEEICVLIPNCCKNFRVLYVPLNTNSTNRILKAFNLSLEFGFLKNPVTLYVESIPVEKNILYCDKLILRLRSEYVDENFRHMNRPYVFDYSLFDFYSLYCLTK